MGPSQQRPAKSIDPSADSPRLRLSCLSVQHKCSNLALRRPCDLGIVCVRTRYPCRTPAPHWTRNVDRKGRCLSLTVSHAISVKGCCMILMPSMAGGVVAIVQDGVSSWDPPWSSSVSQARASLASFSVRYSTLPQSHHSS